MNIFFLDFDQATCARYHCDKHVVKMILEYAQLLSTAHHVLDVEPIDAECLYRKTHVNHPSAIWTRESAANYSWLLFLFEELCLEYTYRYGKVHATEERLSSRLTHLPKNISKSEFIEPPLCMPDAYKSDSTVESYRNYYLSKRENFNMVWTKRPTPDWFK